MALHPSQIWNSILAEYEDDNIASELSLYGLACVSAVFAMGNMNVTKDKPKLFLFAQAMAVNLSCAPLSPIKDRFMLTDLKSEIDAVRQLTLTQSYSRSRFIYYYASVSLGILRSLDGYPNKAIVEMERERITKTAFGAVKDEFWLLAHDPASVEADARWIQYGGVKPNHVVGELQIMTALNEMIEIEQRIFSKRQNDFNNALFAYIVENDTQWHRGDNTTAMIR